MPKDNSENQVMFSLHGVEVFKYEINKDRKDYIKYSQGELKNITKERNIEMEILSLLEQLGYPMDEMGTYLYKNMIVKIVNHLEIISTPEEYEELILQLKNKFSQFYLDVSRNDLDIGVKTFHKYIETAVEKTNYSKADSVLLFQIFDNYPEEIEYGEQVLILGSYVLENLKQKQSDLPKVKKLINVSENK